jgi:Glycosyltransferase like family 2
VTSPALELSVVVTLMDDRGHTEECLSSWTRGQTFARDRYEVIVVGSGREAAIEAIARPLLGANDRLLRFEASNELALHHFGAQQARGKWLLFTEAHCVAEPHCLNELIAYLQQHEGRYVGACIRSTTDHSANRLAGLEERWYRDGFADWSREGDWRKVTIRGTAVRRDVYENVGGFRSEFGCFAEILLAAELDANGYRLGYAPSAAIKHYNSHLLGEVLGYVREYREGEAAFRSREDAAQFSDYFGWSRDWDDSSAADRRLARACAGQSLKHALQHPTRRGALATARTMLGVLVRSTAGAAIVSRTDVLRAAASYIWSRALFALPFVTAENRYRHFVRLWEATGNLARRRALSRRTRSAREQATTTMSTALDYRPGEMPSGILIGFHGRELYQGRPFRWSQPISLVRVSVPVSDYDVHLDTGGFGIGPAAEFCEMYLNGHRLRRAVGPKEGPRIFVADRAMFNGKSPQTLTLTSGRLWIRHSTEHRALGIPVFAITFVASQTARSASFQG